MNVCDNLGDHLVGNVYIKVREGGREEELGREIQIRGLKGGCSFGITLLSAQI